MHFDKGVGGVPCPSVGTRCWAGQERQGRAGGGGEVTKVCWARNGGVAGFLSYFQVALRRGEANKAELLKCSLRA